MPAARLKILMLFTAACCVLGCTKRKVHDLFPIPPTTRAVSEFFGCKINGLPFTPKAPSESGLGNCTYRFAYTGDEGYVFQITSNSHQPGCRLETVTIVLDSIELKEGAVYELGSPGSKKLYGLYSVITDCTSEKAEMYTSDAKPGRLQVTKFDSALKYVAGSFSFTVIDASGNEFRISEGLFDQLLTN
jgi:hypothetical protein